eukprot:1130120-Pyramimonas_sp.AAC.1
MLGWAGSGSRSCVMRTGLCRGGFERVCQALWAPQALRPEGLPAWEAKQGGYPSGPVKGPELRDKVGAGAPALHGPRGA